VPDSDAERACRSIGEAWEETAVACGFEATMPDQDAVCGRAYSFDADELNGSCLPWIRSLPCLELNNEAFQAHCGKAISLKTW
jgi:hypothetical protein